MTATRYLYSFFGPPQPSSTKSKLMGTASRIERGMMVAPTMQGGCSVVADAAAVKPSADPSFLSSAWERRSRSSASRRCMDSKRSFSTGVPKRSLGTREMKRIALIYCQHHSQEIIHETLPLGAMGRRQRFLRLNA